MHASRESKRDDSVSRKNIEQSSMRRDKRDCVHHICGAGNRVAHIRHKRDDDERSLSSRQEMLSWGQLADLLGGTSNVSDKQDFDQTIFKILC